MKSLKKNGIFNIIYTILSLVFPLISSIYVARILSPAVIGHVSFAMNYTSYFIAFATLGVPNYGLREVAKRKSDSAVLNKFFTELFIINFIATTISILIYIITIICIGRFREDMHLYIACGLLIVLNYFNIDWLYQGEEEYGYIVVRSFLTKLVALLALILLIKDKSDYIIYAWISSLAVAGNNIFNIIHTRKIVSFDFRNIHIRQHLSPVFIMAAGVLLSTIYGKIDILMLGILSNDTHTGYYTNAYKLINLVITVCTAMTTVFMPRLSCLYSEDRRKFTELLNKGIEFLVFLTVPAFIGIFLLTDQIILILFGSEFLPASATVRMLAILIVIKGIGNLLCYQLVICTGNERERLPATIWASVTNIILNAIMIRSLFEVGVAFASVISEIIVNGYQLFKVKKVIEMHFAKKIAIQSIISTLCMGIVVYLITQLEIGPLLICFLAVIVGLFIYIIVNIIMKNKIAIEISQNLQRIFSKKIFF